MKSTATLISLSAALLLSACASHQAAHPATTAATTAPTGKAMADITADIQPQMGDSFLISLPGTPGQRGGEQLKPDALKQADAYCASLNKGLKVEEAQATSTRPSGYDVRFSCVARPAPE